LPSTPELSGSASIGVTCTSGVSWSLRIDAGLNYDGTDRFMANSQKTDKFKYTITYLNNPIGVDTAFINRVSTGNVAIIPVTVKIPTGQNIYSGNYSDQLTFNIDY
jgi:spore coat protein U-like protein